MRQGLITAGRIGRLLEGEDSAVKREMLREYHNLPSEFVENVASEWSAANRDGAIAEFLLETGLVLRKAEFLTDGGIFGGKPDGFIKDNAILKVKTPYRAKELKPIAEHPKWMHQVQLLMHITGRHQCYFYQWLPDGRTKLELVAYDHGWYDRHKDALLSFYHDFMAERDTFFSECDELIAEYDACVSAEKEAAERKKAILSQLVEKTGGGKIGTDGRALYQVERQGAIAYAKIVEEHLPEIDTESYRGKPSKYWALK